jgi:amino acid permease
MSSDSGSPPKTERKTEEPLRRGSEPTRRESQIDNADDLLENLGYKPELSRNRSTLQVAFMSFVLASIPYGLATTLYYPLVGGGPVDIIWGWVGVSLIIVCVAASLGEITSVYPTAGGTVTLCLSLSPSVVVVVATFFLFLFTSYFLPCLPVF